ncbi:putative Ig domain-containing protein [Hyalangium rubrum]|uniref:Ig domain-containing protein n=1 Tax=Hyalangium rubrum TaxID=3103134 RepID=A0ABU5H187_9BACT|nr:putative Ig domain-containing protein [Hyalangium sp. s54d21]MDY7227071.1 putative Ig domain-containing protein [Hyalangium sp. s54d21]
MLVACVVALRCGPSSPDEAGTDSERSGLPLPPIPLAPLPFPALPPPPDAGTPPPSQSKLCAPEGGGTHLAVEGKPLTVTLRCGKGLSTPELRFTVSPLPEGASMDEATGTLSWTPRKDQVAIWSFLITEATTGEAGVLVIAVVDT